MADANTCWYANSVGYAAVTPWSTGTAKTVGALVRQLTTPTVGNERVYVCIVAGTTHATTEPTWTVTRGAKPTDGTVTWQECTGHPAVNGDIASTAASSAVRSTIVTLGGIIKNNAQTHYFISSVGGTASGTEPTFNTTTGATTVDGTNTWTCIGPVSNFTTGGAAPHARVFAAGATNWYTNGQIIFVGHNHAETQAAAYTLSQGQLANPFRLICHNAAGSYPPTAATTGATITTTGANSITLTMGGSYVEGVTFSAGTGATNAAITFGGGLAFYEKYKNCSFQVPGTTASASKLTGGNITGRVDWENCTVKFGNVGDSFRPRENSMRWFGTGQILAAGSAVPTSLFLTGTTGGTMGDIHLEDLDLGQCTGNIINCLTGAQDLMGWHVIRNCKLHVTAVPVVLSPGTPAVQVDVINCSSGAINYDSRRHTYQGVQTTETTIVRTGGATNGTTPVSAKIVTTTGNRWEWAFECIPIVVWNETTGSSMTATVEGIWGGSLPNNDDIWIEAVYPSDASTPLGTRVSGGKATFSSANAPLASSSETWGGSTTKFKMTVTFTPQMKGFIYVYVKVGRVSATFYIDPLVTLS